MRDKEHDYSSSRQLDIGYLPERMLGKERTLSCTRRKAHAAHAEGSRDMPIVDAVYHIDKHYAVEVRGIGVEQVGLLGGR